MKTRFNQPAQNFFNRNLILSFSLSALLLIGLNSNCLAQQWAGSSTIDNSIYRNGSVGIGTSNPARKLTVCDSDATIRIEDSDGGGYSTIQDIYGGTYSFLDIRKVASSGYAIIKISPVPQDGTSGALWEVFRSTNTTGEAAIRIYKGNGTGTE
ncbi:hypothetical protein K8R42_04140, partial [bacterium]|nr:hypothetical protein [bacterium]